MANIPEKFGVSLQIKINRDSFVLLGISAAIGSCFCFCPKFFIPKPLWSLDNICNNTV